MGLDVGEKRVGIALARAGLRMALPLTTLDRQADDFWQQLLQVMKQNDVDALVVGLPRNLEGQETGQTAAARQFAQELATQSDIPQTWQDEALTSVKAEEILRQSNKPYEKGDIDALAASLILSDYLEARQVNS